MIAAQSNVLYRTFFIKAAQYGTAFTIDVGGQEYLVTARHLFDIEADSHAVQLFQNNQWVTHEPAAIAFCRGEIDIAVMRLSVNLTPPSLPVIPTIGHLSLGQDVYILGFPHQMYEDVGQHLGGNPCPLVKRGTAANLGTGDPQVLYVDTLSNVGFSGGPVAFIASAAPNEVRIAAVISGFKLHPEPVLGQDGEETGMTVMTNTGLLRAYGIKHALNLIDRMQVKAVASS